MRFYSVVRLLSKILVWYLLVCFYFIPFLEPTELCGGATKCDKCLHIPTGLKVVYSRIMRLKSILRVPIAHLNYLRQNGVEKYFMFGC